MNIGSTIVLDRDDLLPFYGEFKIEALRCNHFKMRIEDIRENPLIIFIDEDKVVRVLKNRYGKKGIVR